VHYIITKPHKASYPEALIAAKGSRLSFERKPTEWAGWLWCIDSAGKSGWVPESWVNIDGDHCTLIRDYSTAELTINIGDIVNGDVIESGWVWVQNQKGDFGWVPLNCVEPV
jgi:hypothetical protein